MRSLKKGLSKGFGSFLTFLDKFDKDVYFKLELRLTEPRKEYYAKPYKPYKK